MADRGLEDRERAERHLFIIARDQASLWEYLRREFASETNVEVILDRRLGRDRRSAFDRIAPLGPMGETMDDRRTGERRIRDFVAAQLRSIGYAMLRIRRSEERRVGKECRAGWSPYHYTKKSAYERTEAI